MLVRQILGAVAGYERSMIRLRLAAGRDRKKLTGGFAGGGVPYGYRSVHGELVHEPAEQEGLRQMRQMRRAGRSYREMAAALEARGFPPPRSATGKWQPNTIRTILIREDARRPSVKNVTAPLPQLEEARA